ncbi:MAG: DUF2680 domain-containing protein [Oscillospiraceae bacterium]
MKKFGKIAAVGAIVLVIGATSVTALAASGYSTPADIVAGLTGKTAEDVIAERADTGKTYGTIADEAGVLDEFEDQMLESKEAILEERVADGTMTQERADAIITAMEENQANCDGSGTGGIGAGLGAGFGMNGNQANCDGSGTGGIGAGLGTGFGMNGQADCDGTGTGGLGSGTGTRFGGMGGNGGSGRGGLGCGI